MPPPRTETIKRLLDYTALIEELQKSGETKLWFRGSKASHELIPSLYRRSDVVNFSKFVELESGILTRFKQRSIPYQNRPMTDDWDYLFLMQHHGVPTRLLDWTENPYIALYFALDGNMHDDEDAAVWVLDPGEWNRKALEHISFAGDILSSTDEEVKSYAPGSDLRNMYNQPVSIYGAYNSPRIVAQRGTFTIFGKTYDPMEKTYDDASFPEGSLVKVRLPAESLESLHQSVLAVGFTASVVYPDLDGLAQELKWQFGFRR